MSFNSKQNVSNAFSVASNKAEATSVATDLINGKRRRGRKESQFATYNQTTRKTIKDLEEKIEVLEKTQKKDKKTSSEVKRLKNMVSAYESRLLKRAIKEDLRAQVDTQNAQITSIMNIIKQELSTVDLHRVSQRIINETPAMKPFVAPQ